MKDTVNEYWFLLAEAIKDEDPKADSQKKNK